MNCGELVCKIVNVAKSRVQAEAASGWERVGGITSPKKKGSENRAHGSIQDSPLTEKPGQLDRIGPPFDSRSMVGS